MPHGRLPKRWIQGHASALDPAQSSPWADTPCLAPAKLPHMRLACTPEIFEDLLRRLTRYQVSAKGLLTRS